MELPQPGLEYELRIYTSYLPQELLGGNSGHYGGVERINTLCKVCDWVMKDHEGQYGPLYSPKQHWGLNVY